jgi:Flp pilus assembly protein TadD
MYRPGFALARALRVATLQALGRLPEAIAAARDSLEKVPPVAELHVVLGRALLASGQTAEALESLRSAVELEDDNPVAILALAEALDATGKRPKAAELYRSYLKFPARRFEDGLRIRRRLRKISGG